MRCLDEGGESRRWYENPVTARSWGFDSPLRHQLLLSPSRRESAGHLLPPSRAWGWNHPSVAGGAAKAQRVAAGGVPRQSATLDPVAQVDIADELTMNAVGDAHRPRR